MHLKLRIALFIFLIPQCVLASHCPNVKTELKSIRKRRHLAFPAGSNYVLTAELAKAFMTHVPSGWIMTMSTEISFPLPDDMFIGAHLRKKLHHKQKRDFWDRLREAFDLRNFNGHSCILRSICEAKIYLAPPGKSLVHDVLRALFTAPVHHPEFSEEFGDMYSEMADHDLCEKRHECPFSIIDFILTFNKKRK